jgi:dTDP-4-dehydrorhamnose 3,5-epimerase
MIFTETPLGGAFVIELERHSDERGTFARVFDADEWRARGLNPRVAQCSVSFNERCGTLRGLHYQAEPWAECKLVRCTRGAIYDVIVDLRPGSTTFTHWFGVELTEANDRLLYIPAGLAHGFQTLVDACEVSYQISQVFVPEAARGVRWDDPVLAIEWPNPGKERVISSRDRGYADFRPISQKAREPGKVRPGR